MENFEICHSNEWFNATIALCTSDILNESEEIILWRIYEEFDTSSISFLHENTLNLLLQYKCINEIIYRKAAELRMKAISIFDAHNERSLDFILQSREWKEIFKLCDTISELKKPFDESDAVTDRLQ